MTFALGGLSTCVLAAGALALAVTAHAQGITDMKKGEGRQRRPGLGGPERRRRTPRPTSSAATSRWPTVAVVEPQSYVMQALTRYRLGSPSGLIRLMIQQSNCFLVVERGVGMQNMMQERALPKAGELRQDSNVGGGQMVTADYVLTPAVVFSEDNAGGVGGGARRGVGGLFGSGGRALGAVAGGLKFKEAQTSMLLADARSSLQVAAAEGSAKKADFRLGGLFGGRRRGRRRGAALGGYSNTTEGKVIAASFADNYNGIVRAVRGNPSLQRNVGTLAGAEAGAPTKAGAVFNEGDVLRPKIANVRLLTKPSEQGDAVATLAQGEELIFMGKEQDGFVSVETSKGSGWVKKVLVTK